MNYLCSIIVALLLFISPVVDAAPSREVLQRVSRSLVKIETGTTSASGFIWSDSSYAVTSLHVVDGQNRITAHYVNANGNIIASSKAVVKKVLKESDLVLLRLEKPLSRAPLSINTSLPTVKQSLDALGFPLNIAGYSSTEVKVRFGGNQLHSILPQKVLNNIRDYPSITTQILNLEGNIVPGLSGAPIIDDDGKVIGIVDGGLENGAIGICWGIPASHLQRLSKSTVTQLPRSAGIPELFAADLKADVGQTQFVGKIRLTKLRSRTFQQLAATADDQLGLVQLANSFSSFNPYYFRYDIYQDMKSGATIVVPEGAEISSHEDFTVASMNEPRMEIKFQITRVQNLFDAHNKAVIFEQQLTELENYVKVILDPAWSYLFPLTRFGVRVNRKGFCRYVFKNFMWQTDKYYFATLASNGNTLLAIAAVNNDNTPQTLQMERLCRQRNYPQCPQLIRSRRIWAQMVLGVQLASFPRYLN